VTLENLGYTAPGEGDHKAGRAPSIGGPGRGRVQVQSRTADPAGGAYSYSSRADSLGGFELDDSGESEDETLEELLNSFECMAEVVHRSSDGAGPSAANGYHPNDIVRILSLSDKFFKEMHGADGRYALP